MLHKKYLFFIFILVFIFYLRNAHSKDFLAQDSINPYCGGVDIDEILEKKEIDKIEINTKNTRKWIKNLFRTIVAFNSNESKTDDTQWFNFRIEEKYKRLTVLNQHILSMFKKTSFEILSKKKKPKKTSKE